MDFRPETIVQSPKLTGMLECLKMHETLRQYVTMASRPKHKGQKRRGGQIRTQYLVTLMRFAQNVAGKKAVLTEVGLDGVQSPVWLI